MSAHHVVALLNSHINRDEDQFLSIVLQIAAQEARKGHVDAAKKLKRLVQKARTTEKQSRHFENPTLIPTARPNGELREFVESTNPKLMLSKMILTDSISENLHKVVNQQKNREKLRNFSRKPSTHILLYGPPGTGKTYTASAFAGELRLPLFTVKLETLFSRFFGETSNKIRQLFDQIAQIRGVYFFDEFDAIGASRGISNDIGEVRRILNSILTFMEEPNSTDSLVIAATNHVKILDGALARRFDEVIEYELPDLSSAKLILNNRLGKFKFTNRLPKKFDKLLDGLSQSELVWVADNAVKDAILNEKSLASPITLQVALEKRQTLKLKFQQKMSADLE